MLVNAAAIRIAERECRPEEITPRLMLVLRFDTRPQRTRGHTPD
jgi:hypothetical protein